MVVTVSTLPGPMEWPILIRLNQIMCGAGPATSSTQQAFATPQGRWKPVTADGIELFHIGTVPVTRYRYRGSTIPSPWPLNHA